MRVIKIREHYQFTFDANKIICEDGEQFTGLQDSKGKDIYEGDILSRDSLLFVCEYIANRAEPGFTLRSINHQTNFFSSNVPWQLFTIVGNVRKNPELLK